MFCNLEGAPTLPPPLHPGAKPPGGRGRSSLSSSSFAWQKQVPRSVEFVEVISPPYVTRRPWRWPNPESIPAGSGALFCLRSGSRSWSPPSLVRFLERFEQVYPGVSISLLVRKEEKGGNPLAMPEAGQIHPSIRAVFFRPPDPAEYRAVLCQCTVQGLAHWLLTIANPPTLAAIGAITCVSRFFFPETFGSPRATPGLRRQLRLLGLPRPKRWEMVARALPNVLKTQLEDLPVTKIAHRAGYSDDSAFRRDCRLLFGRPPSALRLQAGWNWLLQSFVERERPSREGGRTRSVVDRRVPRMKAGSLGHR